MPKKSMKRRRKAVSTGIEKDIKEALKEKKLVIGTRVVFKEMKKGRIKKVIYASNCPAESMKNLEQYGKSGAGLGVFKGDSLKLGEVCGKPFKALMVGIKK
jgi:ribosomal protein L30E